jgi:Tannase and feruloyl esterase
MGGSYTCSDAERKLHMRYHLASVTFTLAAGFGATCDSLATLTLPGTTINVAQSVPAGSFTPPAGQPINNLPAFCRIAGILKPAADSNIQFEVWMPATGWNGKFQGLGNGGFAGSVNFAGLGLALAHGYAAASTDTGHQAGGTDGNWASGHREKLIDFGYRAIHEMTEKGKAITRAFYGEQPKHSYFSSCSNGGRQALMEAQRYPADYDGIIAGAPANSFTHLLTGAMWNAQALTSDPAAFIPSAKVPAIEAATLSACDTNDGVKDGVIDDPSRCNFDPAVLLCSGPESNTCLTQPQITALKKIYGGARNSKGEQLFPGWSPGGEMGFNGWQGWITGSAPAKSIQFAFGSQFFQNMVYEDAAWDYRTFDVDHTPKVADDKLASVLNATDSDLKRFEKHGGKLIIYHGWSDAAIAPTNAINYYQSVVSKMGAKEAAGFVKLYMVPGMQHCSGGPGPNVFGQSSPAEKDPEHDISAALERWVEQGSAPAAIIATKFKGDTPSGGVLRTRPLCAYPLVAHWNGTGSSDDAANFTCVKPR